MKSSDKSNDKSGFQMEAELENKEKRPGSRLGNILLIILFLVGAGITFYPVVSKTWNHYRDQKLILEYEDTVDSISEERCREILNEAIAYNEQHTSNDIIDAFNQESEDYVLTHPYDTLLNPSGNMIMGYLEIPKIKVSLPIYHGISSTVLQKGVGHIEGTSLPVGGINTHTVLAGHRGLPERKLLTDLDQVKLGDKFYISVMSETLAYEIDSITVVEPHETEPLAIVSGEDLSTIVTCTPYGVNSHRLLVRGHRIPYIEDEKKEYDAMSTGLGLEEKLLIAGLSAFAAFVLLLLLTQKKREKHADET